MCGKNRFFTLSVKRSGKTVSLPFCASTARLGMRYIKEGRRGQALTNGGGAGGTAKGSVLPQGVKKEFLPTAVLSLPVYCLSAASFDW